MTAQAVIFDFDGIIIDSEPLHHRAFNRILVGMGLDFSWDHYHRDYLGYDDRDVFRERFKEAGRALDQLDIATLMEKKGAAYAELMKDGEVVPYPGVVELIRALSADRPLAICSGALLSDINPVLDILDLQSCFSTKVTADQVAISKPHPECYCEAYRRLAKRAPDRVTHPGRCVAIEDTPAGIAAARGAGLLVLAVSNTYSAARLDGATAVVDSLAAITPATLDELVALHGA